MTEKDAHERTFKTDGLNGMARAIAIFVDGIGAAAATDFWRVMQEIMERRFRWNLRQAHEALERISREERLSHGMQTDTQEDARAADAAGDSAGENDGASTQVFY